MKKMIVLAITMAHTALFAELVYNTHQNIATDTTTTLQWQDDATVKVTKKRWSDAMHHCKELRLGGFEDWRLPSLEDFQSVVNLKFKNIGSDIYWTSTVLDENKSEAWTSETARSKQYTSRPKKKTFFVTCVRGGDSNASKQEIPIEDEPKHDESKIVAKEINIYSRPAVCDFILSREPELPYVLKEKADNGLRYVKKLDENRSLYMSVEIDINYDSSVVIVRKGKQVEVESMHLEYQDDGGVKKDKHYSNDWALMPMKQQIN